ncbi:MAG TPA: NUDIX hydrolase [Thermoanaerobaculia bacterium]|nr:NUDIX hydrolase [Thermoanaerobaculia bacterium]
MDEVIPLPAASVLLLRDGPLEVLMLRRHEKSSFMPGAWVFPGGIAEKTDMDMRVTAVRETFEESGIWLGAPLADAEEKRRRLLAGEIAFGELLAEGPVDLDQLVPTSRWITPVGVPKRFDTWFYLAAVSRDVVATAELNELVDAVWISPPEALAKHAERSMQIMFPTARNLEALVGFASAAELMESRRGAVIVPIQPVLVNGKPTLR